MVNDDQTVRLYFQERERFTSDQTLHLVLFPDRQTQLLSNEALKQVSSSACHIEPNALFEVALAQILSIR